MPLVSGKSKASISRNIEIEVNAGKPTKQAAAIAYSKARDIKIDCAKDGVLEEQDRLYAENKAAGQALNAIPKTGKMGLTGEATKALPEWQAAKRRYDQSLADLQDFNSRNRDAIKKARSGARDIEIDCSVDEPPPALDSAEPVLLAMDRGGSMRTKTVDGRLVVKDCRISKANICPYLGKEIPGFEALGLDPEKIYRMYRSAKALEESAPTFERIPLMLHHVSTTAGSPQKDTIIGAVSNVRWLVPYLVADLTAWADDGIEAIESERQCELSPGYRYSPNMTPGVFEGQSYDGVMDAPIIANHLAIVDTGRTGPDVAVNDSAPSV